MCAYACACACVEWMGTYALYAATYEQYACKHLHSNTHTWNLLPVHEQCAWTSSAMMDTREESESVQKSVVDFCSTNNEVRLILSEFWKML